MLITLTNIYAYVHNSATCNKKSRPLEGGEQLYKGEHIVQCGLLNENIVEAKCLTSKINAPPHKIRILFLNASDYKQWQCSCSCKAGAGEKCKHIVATLLYVYHATDLAPLSCTDIAQKWDKRIQQRLIETVDLEQFCHVFSEEEKNDNNVSDSLIMLKAFEAVPESESARHFCEVRKSVESGSGTQKNVVRTIIWKNICERAAFSKFNAMLVDVKVEDLKTCCVKTYNKLYPCNAYEMCESTADHDGKWQEERQFRITGTRCYALFTYGKDDWETKALKYFYPKSFTGNYATKFGQEQEKLARATYQAHLKDNEDVVEYGLAVCEAHPWLACSPDGIIVSEQQPIRVLEIKCPVIGSKKTIIECLPLLEYMKSTMDGFKLKKKHTYFAQVQLAMCILNIPTCDFILYSSYDNSIYIDHINVDEKFCQALLTKLKQIFFNKMLHVLCNLNK